MRAEIRARVEAAEIHRDRFPHVVVEDLREAEAAAARWPGGIAFAA